VLSEKQIVCFDFCTTLLSESFIILRRIYQDIAIYVCRSSCELPVILIMFESNLMFLDIVSRGPDS